MKYRKKPVVVDAFRFYSKNDVPKDLKCVCSFGLGESNLVEELLIPTLEGTMKANIGDWIIKGVQGEFYPVKDHIFEQTYELLEDNNG
jgi:hypothetical protein